MRPLRQAVMTKTKTRAGRAKQRTKRLVRSNHGKRRIENLVAGILLDKGRFLVEKRRLDKEADPGYVEIPGGHVKPGETSEEALRREMMEELGIKVEKARMVQKAFATATNGEKGRIHYFHIERWEGRIQSNEAERVYWESDISKLSIVPDRNAIRSLRRTQDGVGAEEALKA
jgi:8-oxo-dGTP diphosphatase